MVNRKISAILCKALLLFSIFTAVESKGGDMADTNSRYVEVHAEHILVETESQADEILQKIKDEKVSFEDAARESSKCPSGKEGGDLGYFRRGAMVKEFEEAAFTTDKGEISKPIKTQFGWHLIKVIDKK
jgi:parvulin-like peptidyl-prolyl isomerase